MNELIRAITMLVFVVGIFVADQQARSFRRQADQLDTTAATAPCIKRDALLASADYYHKAAHRWHMMSYVVAIGFCVYCIV